MQIRSNNKQLTQNVSVVDPEEDEMAQKVTKKFSCFLPLLTYKFLDPPLFLAEHTEHDGSPSI